MHIILSFFPSLFISLQLHVSHSLRLTLFSFSSSSLQSPAFGLSLAHCTQQHDSNSIVAASRTPRFPKALKQTSSRLGWLAIEIYPKWKSCLKEIRSENTFQKPLCLLRTIPHIKGDKELSFHKYCHVSYGGKNESIRLLNVPNDIFLAGEEDREGRIPIGKRTNAESWSLSRSSEPHLINPLHACLLLHGWLSFEIWKSGAESSLERSMSQGQISWRLQNFSLCPWALDGAKQESCLFSTSSQRREPGPEAGRPPHCDLGTDLDFGPFLLTEKASGTPEASWEIPTGPGSWTHRQCPKFFSY